jgi:hypothetical protein
MLKLALIVNTFHTRKKNIHTRKMFLCMRTQLETNPLI